MLLSRAVRPVANSKHPVKHGLNVENCEDHMSRYDAVLHCYHVLFGLLCRCIDALRQLESAESRAHPAVGLLAMQAFLAAGNVQQAEMEAAGGGTALRGAVSLCQYVVALGRSTELDMWLWHEA
jgi:hypothetical protein